MIFGPSGNSHDPPNPFFLTLEPQNYFKKYKNIPKYVHEIIFWEISESQKSTIWEQTCAEKSLGSLLSDLQNLEDGINIFQKT